jgi:hypothetical protein
VDIDSPLLVRLPNYDYRPLSSPGCSLIIFCLHRIEHQKPLVRALVALVEQLRFFLDAEDVLDDLAPLRGGRVAGAPR